MAALTINGFMGQLKIIARENRQRCGRYGLKMELSSSRKKTVNAPTSKSIESEALEYPLNAVKTAILVGKLSIDELAVFESDKRRTVITAIEKRKEALKK